MKKLTVILLTILIVSITYGNPGGGGPSGGANATAVNQLNSSQSQVMQGQGFANAEGGNADSHSYSEGGEANASSGSIANISTNSVSNYENRTAPISAFPPYLPAWNHSGWGTVKAYFQNGPNSDDRVYERAFYPDNAADMRELRGIIESLPYESPLNILGGLINGVVATFGGPDNFHHGRGFEIASSLIRTRRPSGKPMLVFIDSEINRDFLKDSGYAYVGKISLEGTVDRNWDHVYDAAIAEALPWNVDILLISGGMKGVTVGYNNSFPSAAGAYSQTNYSISLLGGRSSGLTEGKGEAILSAECYRYYPQAIRRRTIPQSFYDKIHSKVVPAEQTAETPASPVPTSAPATESIIQQRPGIEVSQELFELAGISSQQSINNMALR